MLLVIAGCTPPGVVNPSLPEATANVQLVSISPEPGAELTEGTTVVAEIRYSIEGFQPGVDYYIGPVFQSTKGEGHTFSMVDDFTDQTKITAPQGTVTIRYDVARELRSPRLQRPVTLWIYAMERIGAHQTRVIGQTQAIRFR